MLAQVLVLGNVRTRTNARPVYTYAVPETLADQVAPGQLVSVPFGSRLAPGIVWTLSDDHDDAPAALRSLEAPLDLVPLVSAERMALAEWLADRYTCSLALAAQLMLPPGLVSNMRVVLRPSLPDVMSDASGWADADVLPPDSARPPDVLRDDAALLGVLRARGEMDERALRDTLGADRAQTALAALLATGAATRGARTPAVLTPPREETRLRLAGSDDVLAAWRDAARHELDQLAPLSRGAPVRSASLPRGRDERRAERLLRQLAVFDLLHTPSGAAHPQDAPRIWRLNEVRKLTRITPAALSEMVRAGVIALESVAVRHDPLGGRSVPPSAPLPLTAAQQRALATILAAGTDGVPSVVLLHGVTGSGKTEVYLQSLAAHLANGRRGLVLVPEIALTPQAMVRFAGRFPGRVALLHSGLSDAERLDEWRRIRDGQVDVVVGSRSALFSPIERLGVIVVDEEHETAYKQDGRPPTYHARDVAIELGRLTGATVVLGSATPSVESFWQARRDVFRLVELAERAPSGSDGTASRLPPVTLVDLRAELRAGNTSILGMALQKALTETLNARQQAVLFLNRRGAASCVICRECGYVALCGRCDVPMTYHASERALVCHYCGRQQPAPAVCPHCWSASIRYFGIGTERVEMAVKRLFPHARVLRWDRDTARSRHAHEELLTAFAERRADVLVGTQMIAKGLDLPGVTLVGVVSADVALYLPDFRASERAFQLLTQVAGRAGRGDVAGRVIVQTFNPDHFCIQAAARHDYHDFYTAEISARERYDYPPFRRFAKFTYTHADRHHAQVEAALLADRLERLIRDHELDRTDIVGPAPAFMERLRGHYRWQLMARGPDLRPLLHALASEDLPRGWSVDVDPVSTL